MNMNMYWIKASFRWASFIAVAAAIGVIPSLAYSQCQPRAIVARGPLGQPFVNGVDVEAESDANGVSCDIQNYANGVRMWLSVEDWNYANVDDWSNWANWGLIKLKADLLIYKSKNYKTFLTVSLAKNKPYPTNPQQVINTFNYILNYLSQNGTSLVDVYGIGNEIGVAPDFYPWPGMDFRNPFHYVNVLFYGANKAIKMKYGNSVLAAVGSTFSGDWAWPSAFFAQVVPDLVSGFQNATMNEKTYYLPGFIDAHTYETSALGNLDRLQFTRTKVDNFVSQIRTIAQQTGANAFTSYQVGLVSSEFNCSNHGQVNQANNNEIQRTCLNELYTRTNSSGKKLTDLVDQMYYFIYEAKPSALGNPAFTVPQLQNNMESALQAAANVLYTGTTVPPVIPPPSPSNLPPSITMTAPSSNLNISVGSSVNFKATGSDSDGYVAKIELINAAGATLGNVVQWTNQYDQTISFSTVGTFVLRFKATDNAGASTLSAGSVTITVGSNNSLPGAVFKSPTSAPTINAGQSVLFEAWSWDPDGSITDVRYLNATTNAILAVASTSQPSPATINFPTAGVISVVVQVTDNAGASSRSQPITVTMLGGASANKAPGIYWISPNTSSVSIFAGQTVAFESGSWDSDGAVVDIRYLNSVSNAVLGISNLQHPNRVVVTFPTAGTYTVVAQATDNLGANSQTAPIVVSVQAGNGAGGSLVISNLLAASNRTYIVGASLSSSSPLYIDSSETYGQLPTNLNELMGSQFIRTAQADTTRWDATGLRFNVSKKAYVYVLISWSQPNIPSWIMQGGYRYMGFGSSSSGGYNIYRKVFDIGQVSLGSNEGLNSNVKMYGVAVKAFE